MYRAFACLTEEHTGWVVALAACVCWISCAVALKLEQRVQVRADGHGPVWLLASGFSIGAGIWSTHFIGMLGYDPGVVLGYEPRTTLLSLIVAIAAATVAFLFARAMPSTQTLAWITENDLTTRIARQGWAASGWTIAAHPAVAQA